MMIFLTQVWSILLELSPWLLLGCFVAGLLHVCMPANFIRSHLGKPGLASTVKAALIGVPMPLCSCSVIPTGIGLKKEGAGTGAAVSFITSTPQTGVDAVAVTVAFLGWPFALFKVFAAFITGIIAGLLAEGRSASKSTENSSDQATSTSEPAAPITSCCGTPTAETPQQSLLEKCKKLWAFAINDLLHMIWRWLVVGILLSAAITTWIGTDSFHIDSTTGTLLAFAAVLAISIPLYVCDIASVPIAAAMVASGLPTGVALVFLMAGPATNIATIGAVARGLGKRALIAYLSVVIIGSVLLGLSYDYFIGWIPNQGLNTSALTANNHEHHPSLFSAIAAVIMVLLFVWFAFKDLRRWRSATAQPTSCCPSSTPPQATSCCGPSNPPSPTASPSGSCCSK